MSTPNGDYESDFPFGGGKTWFRVAGHLAPECTPLVLLHGGPGYPSYYLENLTELATDNRPVIVYDQMSCGRSSGSLDPDDWEMQTFVDQFLALLQNLGIERVDLLGHSWGGFLGLEIALRHPDLLRRLVLASTSPSSQMFIDAATERLHTLPADIVQTIERCDAEGDYNNPEYRKANKVFLHEFCDRMDPLPPALIASDEAMNVELYRYMWGPSEFRCLGTLQDWDVSDRLHEIAMPTLITSGAYDEAGPAIQEFMVNALPNARWECFPNSAHQSHHSDKQAYLETVRTFLDEA